MKKIEKIFKFIDDEGITNSAFEQKSKLSNGYLRNISKTNSEVSGKMLQKMYEAFPTLESYLSKLENEEQLTEGERIRRNKAIGTSDHDLGLIYVPIAAQAGYSRNFEDPVYINQLERLYIPGLPYKGDRYRYFDVEGDSMEPTLEEGMQVIGEQVLQEDWKHVSDFYIYVIVKINRVLIKRLFKKDATTFVLISDNEIHPQEPLKIEEILELWLVKRKLDWRMTPPKRFEITV